MSDKVSEERQLEIKCLTLRLDHMEQELVEKYCDVRKFVLGKIEKENREIEQLVDQVIEIKRELVKVKGKIRYPYCYQYNEPESIYCNKCGKKLKKPLYYYYVVAVLIVMLLNALLFPYMIQSGVKQVGYNTFFEMVDEGIVTQVKMEEEKNRIIFVTEDERRIKYYKTGVFPDHGLREKLEEANVKFGTEIPTQNSPFLSFLLTWILPIVIFFGFGQLLFHMIQKHSGEIPGNAMSFGKSNAKIYAERETGKTFADVAGQEEAKKALTEIVDFLHNPEKYSKIGAKLPNSNLHLVQERQQTNCKVIPQPFQGILP